MNAFWKRLVSTFHRQRLNAELESEIDLHLEMLAAEYRAKGMTAEEARLAARRDFGGIDQTKEVYRDRRGLPFIETLWQDVRFGVRSLARNRGVTAAIVLTLMLGIGANTAVFSVIDSVLLEPLPYRHPERLVWISEYLKQFRGEIVSGPDFLDWKRLSHSFDTMAAFFAVDQTISGGGDAVQIRTVFSSESIGRLLGVSPVLGRDFLPEELTPGPGEPPNRVALITHSLAERRFGNEKSAVGKLLVGSAGTFLVVGILPRDFRLALPSPFGPQNEADAIVNFPMDPASQRRGGAMIIVQVLARLKPGVPVSAARTELETIRAAIAKQYPGGPVRELRMIPLYDRIVGSSRLALLVVWAAVSFVLLVACVNVTNLLLARATARGREAAIRASLGAGRMRLIRQWVTESLVLALAGGAAGLALAFAGVRLLVTRSPIDIPRLKDATLNWNVLAFSLVVCTLAGLLSGIAPALAGSRTSLSETLKDGARAATASFRRRRLQELLVVCELGLAMLLLVGAGLLLKSLWFMHSATTELRPEHVLTAKVEALNPKLARPEEKTQFFAHLADQIATLPGVDAAAFWAGQQRGFIHISGLPAAPPGSEVSAEHVRVTPQFFPAAGLRLLAGRWFSESDQQTAPRVAVFNQALVRRFFPAFPAGQSPIGRQVILPGSGNPSATIVGIVSDFRIRPDADPDPQIFVPHTQQPLMVAANLLVRTSSDPLALTSAVRRIAGATRGVNVIKTETLADQLSSVLAPRRFQAVLLAIFALTALLLAMVGAYGLLSYSVLQRTHEIGVRMALGAHGDDVLCMVLAGGMRLVTAGVVVGLAASFALTRLMRSLLYGVKPTDAWTLLAVSLLLILVTAAAAYIPARRAVRIDPLVALRYE